jgi:hypothetical protein
MSRVSEESFTAWQEFSKQESDDLMMQLEEWWYSCPNADANLETLHELVLEFASQHRKKS